MISMPAAVAALPAPHQIGKQQPVDEKLGVIFRSDARAGLQFEDVETVALSGDGIDAPLNPERRGIALEFDLRIFEKAADSHR